jgi:hypothetical protein
VASTARRAGLIDEMLMKRKLVRLFEALTSTFSVELRGIEPARKMVMTCGYAKGVDDINSRHWVSENRLIY